MLPAYKETYTNYISASGNTQIYIYRRRKRLSERKKKLIQQKLLGLTLVVVGVVGCCVMPEDAGGCLMACGMGIVRMIF